MVKVLNKLKIISVILLILGIIFIGMGFEKKDNYSGEDSIKDTHNAYVGGDAYNYIINSNYFTGYVTLGSACILGAIILYTPSIYIRINIEKEIKQKENNELPEI